jgi:hypothetical protein
MSEVASSFQALKNRVQQSPLSGATTLSDQSGDSKTKNYVDDRFWKLTRDKSGNGAALIRFLDVSEKDSGDKNNLPFVKIYDHAFSVFNGALCPPKTPGAKWYIERSLSTFGEQDILGEENSRLWQTGLDSNKKIASARKRRLTYHSNILVLNDPANPDNNGKVFLFKYGKQIADMIDEVKCPPEDPLAETPVIGYNPFCFWGGANFALKIRDKDDYPSYDKSAFQAPSPLFAGDDTKIEAVWKESHSLQELLDRKHFKTPEELKKRFEFVYGLGSVGTAEQAASAAAAPVPTAGEDDVPLFEDTSAPKPKAASSTAPAFNLDDDESDLQFFENLANDVA